MPEDAQNQQQQQDVRQETVVHAQGPHLEVSCDHYTNPLIEKLDAEVLRLPVSHSQFAPTETRLRKARLIPVLHHQGHVTKVLCSLLDGRKCKSAKNTGNDCYILGPAPAFAMGSWKKAETRHSGRLIV